MKLVQSLTDVEHESFWEAARYAAWMRFRPRTHAVYLSGKGYRFDQMADIFEVDRDAVSGWLDAWEVHGLLGLRD